MVGECAARENAWRFRFHLNRASIGSAFMCRFYFGHSRIPKCELYLLIYLCSFKRQNQFVRSTLILVIKYLEMHATVLLAVVAQADTENGQPQLEGKRERKCKKHEH